MPNNSYDPLNKPSPNDNFALAIADDCTGNSGSSSSNCKGRGLSVLGIRQIFGAEGPVMPGNCAPKIDLTNGVPGTPDTLRLQWQRYRRLPHVRVRRSSFLAGLSNGLSSMIFRPFVICNSLLDKTMSLN